MCIASSPELRYHARMSKTQQECELQGCKSQGAAKNSVGLFQVYDGNLPTMNRPAFICQACVDFAKACGMEPQPEPKP